jgi:hypothetical protein
LLRASVKFGLWFLIVALAVAILPAVAPAHAEEDPPPGGFFTVIVSSAYARAQPDVRSERMFSVFSGETYPVIDRAGDYVLLSNWEHTGWLPADYGLWNPDGPVADETLAAARAARAEMVPAVPEGVIGALSPEALAVYRRGLALGNNPRVFAKIGDCNSENGRFLVMFAEPGLYTLGARYAYLQKTIDYYGDSWVRTSVAAQSGFSPASVMDPVFADPTVCRADEGPLQCEYRLIRPSVALIALGTHYAPTMAQYEADLRVVIEESMRLGVVPILSTKADNVEGGDRINPIIRRLAAEYKMPLWDFWMAAQQLPNGGLNEDGIHPSYARPIFDDPWSMQQGWPWRNLTALLMLDSLRAATDRSGMPGWRYR